MVVIIDRTELSNDQRVELYEEGVTWIVQKALPGARVAQEIKLDAAATQLLDFLLLGMVQNHVTFVNGQAARAE